MSVDLTETDTPGPEHGPGRIAAAAMAGFFEVDTIGVLEHRAWTDTGIDVGRAIRRPL